MPVIQVQFSAAGLHTAKDPLFLQPVTYKDLNLLEKHLEDFIVEHPEILFPGEEETFHVIATQVRNALGDEADIVGLLGTGELVVVEVKRDKADMKGRPEPLEWQAFRYAATLATIKSPNELVPLFAAHISRHQALFDNPPDPAVKGKQLLEEYLEDLDTETPFNSSQHVILVASDFDERTLAACSWLVLNDLPIECIRITPHPVGSGQALLLVERVLPLPTIEDWLPGLKVAATHGPATRRKAGIGPRLPALLAAGLLRVGDELYVKKAMNRTAKIIDGETVEFEGRHISPSKWGIEVTGWPTFSVYDSAYVKRTNQKIKELRRFVESSAEDPTGQDSPLAPPASG